MKIARASDCKLGEVLREDWFSGCLVFKMGIDVNIIIIFNKNKTELNTVMSWLNKHTELEVSEYNTSKYTTAFLLKKSKKLVQELTRWCEEDINSLEHNHKNYLHVGYFGLRIITFESGDAKCFSLKPNEFALYFESELVGLSQFALKNKTFQRCLLNICKALDPRKAYFYVDFAVSINFWPKKGNEVLYGDDSKAAKMINELKTRRSLKQIVWGI